MKGLFLFLGCIFSTVSLQTISAADLETVPADEDAAIQTIANTIADSLAKEHQAKGGIARRDAHAKQHGCVQAKFAVNATLPESLRSGVFQDGKTYDAWIRFSNGGGVGPDKEPDARGMAIKLMGVPGDKILPEERTATTQDFLMINHPVFFVRNAKDYVEFTTASAAGNPKAFFLPGLNPMNWRVHEFNVVRAIRARKVTDLLANPYWSTTPYLYAGRAAKYAVRPCGKEEAPTKLPTSENFLREKLDQTLLAGQGCFHFYVQFQTDPTKNPVEDPTVEWTRFQAPYYRVATITIGSQRFLSDRQTEFCENLSFTPWHSLPDHRPLGGINRVRRVVYETVSNLRHQLNGVVPAEPAGF